MLRRDEHVGNKYGVSAKLMKKNAKVTILPTSCKKYGTNSRNQAAVKLNGIISLLVPGKMLVHDIKG